MTFDLLLTLAGLALLLTGGDVMVRGAAALAGRLNVSPLAIGLTVVAFGTSAPELAVNLTAAFRGNLELCFGNIFGSNMANIGLIVAASALVRPLQIQSVIIRREVPMMLLATLVAAALGLDGYLEGGPSGFGRGDGIALLLLFSVFVYYTINDVLERRADHRAGHGDPGDDDLAVPSYPLGKALLFTALGTAGLVAGGALTVEGAEGVARALGISDAIIGLTLVAVGTSLPELAASLMATFRGHTDLAIGNVVGSNIFNLLVVLGTTATVHRVPVPAGGLGDVLVVIGLSTLLWLTSMSQGRRIIRAEASVLLGIYLAYVGFRAVL